MIKTTKVSASQADYYRQGDPFFIAEDNKWQGKGLDAVGLQDGQTIDYTDFQAVYAGVFPIGSDQAGEQIIPDGGYDRYHEGHHLAGFDITISPDKSISTAYALGVPGISEAFRDACDVTVSMAEELAAARRKTDGIESEVPTGNLVVANINHSVTRESEVNGEMVPDINLHRHAVTINCTNRSEPDGSERLVSLQATPLFEAQGCSNESILNQAFNSQLSANLIKAGFGVDSDDKGNAKLLGIPEPVCELFSKRSEAIDLRSDELRENGFAGVSDGKLKQIANFDTRLGKSTLSGDEIRASWDAQLENAGYSKESIVQAVIDAGKERSAQQEQRSIFPAHKAVSFAANQLAEEQIVFSKKLVYQSSMDICMGSSIGAQDITCAFDDLKKNKDLVRIDGAKASADTNLETSFTTREIAGKQKEILASLNYGYTEPLMTEKEANKTLCGFVNEQRKDDPNYRLSQPDWQTIKKVLTSDSPNLFLHAENEVERGKAYNLLNKVMAFHAEKQTALVSQTPATEQQKSAVVAGIQRDLSRDEALSERDGYSSNFEALVGKDVVDGIRNKALHDAAGSFKRDGDRKIALLIVEGKDDTEIFKATGTSGRDIDTVKQKLFSSAADSASKALEAELDRQTIARQEAHLNHVETLGKESQSTYTANPREAKMRDVLTVHGGKEVVLERQREESGIKEIDYGLGHKWGGSHGSMAQYHVKAHDDKHLAVGTNKAISHGGGFQSHKSDKVIWSGSGKGNRIQSSRTTYGVGFWKKTKTRDAATGTVREVKSSGVRKSFAGFTLFEIKTQKIKETDINGHVTNKTAKSYSFMGYKWGKTVSKNQDGSITETKWRGYEKMSLLGQKKLVITHQETVTKPASPSLFSAIAMAVAGKGKQDSLTDYVSRADQRGKLIEVPQDRNFNSVKAIASEVATKDFKNSTVLTYSKNRADALNSAIRGELLKQGHLEKGVVVEVYSANQGTGKIEAKTIELSKNERIKFGQNNSHLGLKAGESGTIKSIDKNGKMTVQMDFPDKKGEHERTFSLKDYGAVSYSYASTEVDKRTAVGKVIADLNSKTINKDYLAKVDGAVRKGFDVRFFADNGQLIKTQISQYDSLKAQYREMVEQEKKESGYLGKSVVLAQRGGNSICNTLNAKMIDYDSDGGRVSLQYQDHKGKLVTRNHSVENVMVDGGKLVLPESTVSGNSIFKDSVFDRGYGRQPQIESKPSSVSASKQESGFVLTSAETRTLSPLQASKGIAMMERDNRSERLTIIDGNDVQNPRQTAAIVRANEQMGNRAVIIGNSREILGIAPEKLQQRNSLDISQHPEVVNAKGEFAKNVTIEANQKAVDKVFDRLENTGRIIENNGGSGSKEEMVKFAMQEFAGKIDLSKTVILADKYTDRVALNNAIRDELKSQGAIIGKLDTFVTVRQEREMTTADKGSAASFRDGDVVVMSKAGHGFRAGDEAVVLVKDSKNNTLILAPKEGVAKEYDLKNAPGSGIKVYEQSEKGFAEGEKVVLTRDSKKLGIEAGFTGKIASLDSGSMIIEGNGKTVSIDLKKYSYIDHGNAVSPELGHKSQGEHKSFLVDAAEHNIGPAMVSAIMRAGEQELSQSRIFTNDRANLRAQVLDALSKGVDYKPVEIKQVEVHQERQIDMVHQQNQRIERNRNQIEMGG